MGKSKQPQVSPKKRGQKAGKDIPEQPERFNVPIAEPCYFEENGLRKVKPYLYTFNCYVKERWKGRTVLDVYGEFRDRSSEYYEWAISSGAILVNNAPTTCDTILMNGDLISNVIHRHEGPVVAGPVKILYDGRLPGNDGVTMVVEKPGSMPVHGTGRYSFNTLLSILKHDYDLPIIHTSNRLDRLTSGVMVCSLTAEGSKQLGAWFSGLRPEGKVHKEYVARCLGKFPDGEIVCEEPLLTIDRQLGVNVVHPDGRESKTIFKRMSYHEGTNTSVVHCTPITGRSHQIRVHLQYLGHAIANDPIYQNPDAWGPEGGKGGVFKPTLDRPSLEETQRQRKEMGERQMEVEKARIARREATFQRRSGFNTPEVGGEEQEVEAIGGGGEEEEEEEVLPVIPNLNLTLESLTEVIPPEEIAKYSDPTKLHSIINKRGQIKAGFDRSDLMSVGDDPTRMEHEIPMSVECKSVMSVLRGIKDESDGWARWKDKEMIEKSKRAEIAEALLEGKLLELSLADDLTEEEVREKEEDSGDGTFCPSCFVPLVPDPRPDQLFIWLHALRYKTTEWDYQSEYPYWSLETWESGQTCKPETTATTTTSSS